MRVLHAPDPPTGFRRLLFRLPIQLYRMRLGWLLGNRFMLLTHTGRVSGTQRQVVLEAIDHDRSEGSCVGPSGYGTRSAWYRNILVTPQVIVQVGRRSTPMTAHPVTADEARDIMERYGRRHRFVAGRLARFLGFEVDGSAEDFREVGARISFVRFTPR